MKAPFLIKKVYINLPDKCTIKQLNSKLATFKISKIEKDYLLEDFKSFNLEFSINKKIFSKK